MTRPVLCSQFLPVRPTSTRNRVFQNLTVADSGEQTTAVTTYVNRGRQGNEIDQLFNRAVLGSEKIPKLDRRVSTSDLSSIKLMVAPLPSGGVPKQTNSQLNPGSFR